MYKIQTTQKTKAQRFKKGTQYNVKKEFILKITAVYYRCSKDPAFSLEN